MSSHNRHGTQVNQTTSNNTLINDIWLSVKKHNETLQTAHSEEGDRSKAVASHRGVIER